MGGISNFVNPNNNGITHERSKKQEKLADKSKPMKLIHFRLKCALV